ncbi:MAG TPA: hypothetical protein VHI55_06115 [Gaiellaceae bacterium]|nr:hypothetical protein [Gaiellaceae bacterium]
MGKGTGGSALGLLGEVHTCEIEVLLRDAEVGVTRALHHREPRVTGGGVVRDRAVSAVVERPHVVADPRLDERRAERLRVALVVEG